MVQFDEMGYSSPAYELAFHGKMATRVFTGYMGLEEYTFWQPPLYFWLLSLVYRIFGFGLLQTRLFGVLFHAFGAGLIFLIAVKLFDRASAGLFAALFMALDPISVVYARVGRMDSLSISIALTSVVVYMYVWPVSNAPGLTSTRLRFALSGFLAGLSILAHPLGGGVLIGLMLATLLGYHCESMRQRMANVLIMGFMASLAVSIWALYIIQSPETFLMQFFGHAGAHTELITDRSVLDALIAEITDRYIAGYSKAPLVLLAALLGAIAIILRTLPINIIHVLRRNNIRRQSIVLVISLLGTYVFAFALFVRKVTWFLPYIVPYFSLCAGFFSAGILQHHSYSTFQLKRLLGWTFLALVLINLFAASLPGRFVIGYLQRDALDIDRFNSLLSNYIRTNSQVLGPYPLWSGVTSKGSSLYSLEWYPYTGLPLEGFDYIVLPSPKAEYFANVQFDSETLGELSNHLDGRCLLIASVALPARPIPGFLSIVASIHHRYQAEIYQCVGSQ